jgi:hypothetical protein
MGTTRFKFSKKNPVAPGGKARAKQLAKEHKDPIPTDELADHIEEMAPKWKKIAGRKGCTYCQKQRRLGKVPRWKAWMCPICKTGWFLIPNDVKDIDDLF